MKQILSTFALLIALAPSPLVTQQDTEPPLVSVEDLVEVGFSRSRVVMINEAHRGLRRCKRCRMVGRLVLPKAHAAGVRHFAVEALDREFAESANRERKLPPASEGYLAQSDMRELLQAALDLGWTLIAYEVSGPELQEVNRTAADPMAAIDWREEQQARNLVAAVSELPEAARLLVWCGNSHLLKVAGPRPDGSTFRSMAKYFWEASSIEPFSIDQTQSVDFNESGRGPARWVPQYEEQLKASSIGTLGFLTDEESGSPGIDALVVSLHNELR